MKQIIFILLFFQSVFVYSQQDVLNIIMLIDGKLVMSGNLDFLVSNEDYVDTLHMSYMPGYVPVDSIQHEKIKNADSVKIVLRPFNTYEFIELKFLPVYLKNECNIYNITTCKRKTWPKYIYEYAGHDENTGKSCVGSSDYYDYKIVKNFRYMGGEYNIF